MQKDVRVGLHQSMPEQECNFDPSILEIPLKLLVTRQTGG